MLNFDSVSSEMLLLLGLVSVVTFVLSLLLVPLIIVRIPEDYFVEGRPETPFFARLHPLLRLCLKFLKNVLGLIFLVMGILMLVLPGQGLLTILFGIALLDFPGKRELQKRLITYPKVFNSINWIRKKANRPPLKSID